MIEAPELTGTLDRADVRRFFDCADECRVTSLIAADRTQLFFGEVEARGARADALGECQEHAREALAVLCRLAQEVVGQSECRLPTDTWKTGKLSGQVLDG
jgi:hypothetical protein